ncbi:MAG: flagellar hook-basal body complex protein FliE [Nevskia sp.]|nr:flagellar hook-basal body complex protein FliE [Nevskia sp.]
MNEINVNSVLAQIRALSAQASAPVHGASAASAAAPADGFGSLLKDSIDRVNGAQGDAARQQRAFELGDPNTDLSSVMLATSKAQVSFRGMVEVRNRLVSAYQEIMNMPV